MNPIEKIKINASLAFLTYKDEDTPVNEETVFIIAKAIKAMLAKEYGSLPANSWKIVWGPALYAFDLVEKRQANLTFVVQSTDDPTSYIVATRGTVGSDLLEWFVEDLPVSLVDWPTPHHLENNSPKISRATANALHIVLKTTPPKVAPSGYHLLPGAGLSLAEFLTELTSNGPIEISFTGHSLGGAIAPCLALWFRQAQGIHENPSEKGLWPIPIPNWDPDSRASISCVSFAGATPGDVVLRDYFTQWMGNNYYRVYNTFDVVPHAFSDLPALRTLYTNISPVSDLEKCLLDAMEAKVDFVQLKAGTTYATLPNDYPFTGVLQESNWNYMNQAKYQHSDAYILQFDAGDAKS